MSDYLDVDFVAEGEAAHRDLGCTVKPEEYKNVGSCSPIFEERFSQKIIPRGEWQAAYSELKPDYSRHKTWQYDQNGEGTCTANAAACAMSHLWARSYGRENAISPCPTTMYRHCARSANSGSSVPCVMKRARDYGTLLIDHESNKDILRRLGLNPEHVAPAVGWNKRIPEGSMQETAIHFRLQEFYEITSVDGFFSALLLGFPVHYGRSGHSICGIDIVKKGGNWACKYQNSWGQWGDQGFGYDSIDYIKRTSASYGTYAYQSMRAPANLGKLLDVPDLA